MLNRKAQFFRLIVFMALSFNSALALDFEPRTLQLTSLSTGCSAFSIHETEEGVISVRVRNKRQRLKSRRCKLRFHVMPLGQISNLLCETEDAYLRRYRQNEQLNLHKTKRLTSDSCGQFEYIVRTRRKHPKYRQVDFALPEVLFLENGLEPEDGRFCAEVLTCGLDTYTGEVALYSNSCGVDHVRVVPLEPQMCDARGIKFIVVGK